MVGVVLARLLGPGPFGVYTAVLLVGGIGGLVVERGFGGALIQTHDLSEDVVCYAFTWLVLTGLGAAVVLCAAAHSVAALFRYPAMTTAIYGSALYLIMYAVSVVPRALLRRDLDMKSDQIAQVVAYLAGFVVVGIGGAFVGLGAWSLIGALLTQLIVYVLIAYARVQHTIRPLFKISGQRVHEFRKPTDGQQTCSTGRSNAWTISLSGVCTAYTHWVCIRFLITSCGRPPTI